MASRLNIIGIIILLLGFIPLFLFAFIGLPMQPFVGRSAIQADSYTIPAGQSRRVDLGRGVHPGFGGILPLNLKASYLINSQGAYSGEAILFLNSENSNFGQDNRLRGGSFDGSESESKRKSITVLLLPPATSSDFSLYLEVNNNGGSSITISDTYVQVTFTLYAWILPGIVAIAGLIITFLGLRQARKAPRVPKRPKVTPGWEPTLQWSGGAKGAQTTEKRPKMAIKSTKAAKPAKKTVVRRAAPTSGAQASCKFCGKSVSATAFFCPHCYGKLR
ncbi:MAG: hypothetical protein ACFE9L_18135 [Candidatus Hodarchaeota archaeon]